MKLLDMSVSAGALILLVALLRNGKWFYLAKRTVRMLWMIVLARLLLPFHLPIQGKIASLVFGMPQRFVSILKQEKRIHWGGTVSTGMSKAASFGITGDTGKHTVSQAVGWIWLAGLVVMGIYFVVTFWKEYCLLAQAIPVEKTLGIATDQSSENRREVRKVQEQFLDTYKTVRRMAGMKQRKETDRLWIHDQIQSPMVFGIVTQRIVIPKKMILPSNRAGLEVTQVQYILTHEMIHIKRYDNLWKLLSAAALCIHWFNPAVWLMYLLFFRDLELSCDEQVLSFYGNKSIEEYARTLLALAQNQKETTLFCSGFLENPIKERIVAIMKYKKLTGIGVLCAVMLLAGASSVFATNENPNIVEKDVENVQEANEKVIHLKLKKGLLDKTTTSADYFETDENDVSEFEEEINSSKDSLILFDSSDVTVIDEDEEIDNGAEIVEINTCENDTEMEEVITYEILEGQDGIEVREKYIEEDNTKEWESNVEVDDAENREDVIETDACAATSILK